MKKIPVCFCTDLAYAMPTGVSIQSLIENKAKNTFYDIYIITNTNLPQKELEKFYSFKGNDVEIHVVVSKTELSDFSVDGYYVTPTGLLKFEIAEIVKKYNKILYIDGDTLIKKDLINLYNVDLGENYAAVVRDMAAEVSCHFQDRLQLEKYFNSGIMLLNLEKIRKEKLMAKLYQVRRENPDFQCMDQDPFNFVFQEKVIWLDMKYNLMLPNLLIYPLEGVNKFYHKNYDSFESMEKEAVILHLTNEKKPWKYKYSLSHNEWYAFFKKSPWKDEKIKFNMRNSSPINVLYDVSLLLYYSEKGGKRTGIFWVTYNVLKYLSLQKDLNVFLYAENFDQAEITCNNFLNNIPHKGLFYGDVKSMDIFLSPFSKIPTEIKNTGIKCATILYDCIPLILPQYFPDKGEGWYAQLIKSLNSTDLYFSISEYTKSDFLKFCPILHEEQITTIPLSTNLPYKPNHQLENLEKIKRKYHIPQNKKYVFSLCSLEPRKNLIRSVKTFLQFVNKNKISDMVYVLGGNAWDGFIEKFEKEVPEYEKYKDKIIRAGYVDDEDMEILYSNAELFVYTSQYEGFGMPPLEAMSCGCPVITSNNSSLPEVVGDAGIMIDWDSNEQHVKAYEKYYFDKKYREKMAKKGLERSKLFSWEKAADIIVNEFKKCDFSQPRTSFIISKTTSVNIYRVKLFGFIPFLKIRKLPYKIKCSLFSFIPLFEYKRRNNDMTTIMKLFGIQIFKRKKKNNNKTKYYFLGLPILKVRKK